MYIVKKIMLILTSNFYIFILYKVHLSLNKTTSSIEYMKRNKNNNSKITHLDIYLSSINLILKSYLVKNKNKKIESLQELEKKIKVFNLYLDFFNRN